MISRCAKSLILLFTLLSPLLLDAAEQATWDSGISLRPEAPKAGEEVTIMAVLKAGANGARNVAVTGGIDGDSRFSQRIAELRPNRSNRLRFKWIATAGQHTVQFRIGTASPLRKSLQGGNPLLISRSFTVADSRVTAGHPPPSAHPAPVRSPETPERARQQQFSSPAPQLAQQIRQSTCNGTPLPDLVIDPISISGNGRPGTEHTIHVKVRNLGQCDSGVFYVRVEVTEQNTPREIARKRFPSLKPCRTKSCDAESSHSEDFKYTLLPRYNISYDFTVEVDDNNLVEEFIEDNNRIYRDNPIQIYGPENYQ